MTDEELNIKYGAFRHELCRSGQIGKPLFNKLNEIFYWIELNIIHGGEKNLSNKMKIIKPIFIIGDFRSGTSVLERLIVHHPDVEAFNITETFIWKAPKLWNLLANYLQKIREKQGHYGWNAPNRKGIFYPHSSNNRLNRKSSFELEVMWQQCKSNLANNRHFDWKNLDNDKLNPDNLSNEDLLTYRFDDSKFEQSVKNAIKMLLLHREKKRFINKNPLNGFRIGYLKKMFPDGKFIFIARDPIKTTESQVLMQQGINRTFCVNEQEFRENNMAPYIPNKQELLYKYNNKHWAYFTHGCYPNQHSGELWAPRIFPRTVPEHSQISKYLKQNKPSCVMATAVAQHERVSLEQFKDPQNNFKEGENLLIIYHEDVLENAQYVLEKVLQFCELDSTKEERIKWLELENFRSNPNVNNSTSSSSNLFQKTDSINNIVDTKNIMNHKIFKEETKEVMEILEPALQRFYNRGSFEDRIKGKGIWRNKTPK